MNEKGVITITKEEWKDSIVKAMIEAGSYRPFFDDVVNTLAQIMAMRDDAVEQFIQTGSEVISSHTNKFGAKNDIQAPLVRLIRDYDKMILPYMRELCLTPAAHKRLAEKQKKNASLERLINTVEGKL